ncbi:hypothetical protein BX600DRAFT_448702 [Xylariales sp. PMI_506]|nr:hypothetical protein BX600DRAFT_448702 [Xylariales sp. PMI_506]
MAEPMEPSVQMQTREAAAEDHDDQQQQQYHYDGQTQEQQQYPGSPTFAPIYTLVNNTSTRSTYHPQVHYIFSDDDPDLLTQALAEQHNSNLQESASGPVPDHRAILLDLAQDAEGGYSVSWASSLSPSWAVLNAQVNRISPPSSESESGPGTSGDNAQKKQDRFMLRIEGVEGGSPGSASELRLSGERTGQGSGSGSGSGSINKERDNESKGEAEDYAGLVEEFDKRMSMLRKVVEAGEERRRKMAEASHVSVTGSVHEQHEQHEHPDTGPMDDLRRYAEDG